MVAEPLEVAYRLHAAELIRFATAMIGPDDAPDVVTDAMLRVFDGRIDHDDVTHVRALLFRSVHRRIIDHERSRSRRRRRDIEFEQRRTVSLEPDVPLPPVDARAALAVLSTQQRTVVFLTYWCDHTPAEVARVLDVGEGTVRKQLARARARLREVLDV